MHIAVDATHIEDALFEVEELFVFIAKNYPQHRVTIYTKKIITDYTTAQKNLSYSRLIGTFKSFYSYWIYYWFRLSKEIKRAKSDVLINVNSITASETSIPQILLNTDRLYKLNNHRLYKLHSKVRRVFAKTCFRAAKAVVVFSEIDKDKLATENKEAVNKINLIKPFLSRPFEVLEWQQREDIKDKYSQGHEYFVFTENPYLPSNLINILRAYSNFKKWQKTGMKLVLLQQVAGQFDQHKEKIDTYKYRRDLLVVEDLSGTTWHEVISAAYCILLLQKPESYQKGLLEAMNAEVAIIASPLQTTEEIVAEGALLAEPDNHEELTNQMKLIFKDEQLRSRKISEAKQRAAYFAIEKAAAEMVQLIEQTVGG